MSEGAETPVDIEEERLLKTISKVGVRNAKRPVSLNSNQMAAETKGLQEQLKVNQIRAPAPSPTNRSPTFTSPTFTGPTSRPPIPSPGPDRPPIRSPAFDPAPRTLEGEAELSAVAAFNEQRELERLTKWTRVKSTENIDKKNYERPPPAVLLRQHEIEESIKRGEAGEHLRKEHEISESHDVLQNFRHCVTVAAKALKQRNSEAVVTACTAVIKAFVSLDSEDNQAISWSKILQSATDELRTRINVGSSGQEHYNEISNSLGQLYINVVADY